MTHPLQAQLLVSQYQQERLSAAAAQRQSRRGLPQRTRGAPRKLGVRAAAVRHARQA